MDERRVVGRPVTRTDAIEKVTGRAKYGVDLEWPATLHGVVVRAERAHALISRIDTDAVLLRRGVVAVVTHDDIRSLFGAFGHHRPDHAILAHGRVRYWGEPVAVVLAESREFAEDAVEDVIVHYDDLQPLMDVKSAMAPDAPLIHELQPETGEPFGPCLAGQSGTNEAFTCSMGWGDVDAALARAPHTVTTRTSYPMLYAYAMEPYTAQARFVDKNLEVISGAQHPFQVQRDLARVFDITLNRVRISSPFIGGGFGSKSYTKIEPLAAVCSWAVGGRPVKIVLDVEESMYTTRSDSAEVAVTTGFDLDGRILARDIRIVLDTGAYADNSPTVLQSAVRGSYGPYRIPALRVSGRAVMTTTTPASSYRGFGALQTGVATEANLDRAAAELGINIFDLRIRNVVDRGEEIFPGARPMDADLAENLRMVQQKLTITPSAGLLQGMGFSLAAKAGGANPTSSAIVRLLSDGSAILLTGSAEMGQGSRTVLTQIVAEELGLEMEQVTIAQSDTLATPFEWTTGASRTTAIAGLSVQRACQDVRRQVLELAAELRDEDPGDWEWADGALLGPGLQRRTPREVLAEWFHGSGELIGTGRTQLRNDIGQMPAFWEIGMVGVVAVINERTGQVVIDQLVTLADVGCAINPAGLHGQELGGAMQGLGAALFEELVYDGPQIVNANIAEYRVPRISDLPRRVEHLVVERGDGIGPYGAKGAAEGPTAAVGAAIVGAVSQALKGPVDRVPLTPERVWTLLSTSMRDR